MYEYIKAESFIKDFGSMCYLPSYLTNFFILFGDSGALSLPKGSTFISLVMLKLEGRREIGELKG